MNTKLTSILLWLLPVIFFTSCSSSRNIIASGKVTPKGQFKVGGDLSFNIASAPIAEIDDITKSAINAIDNNSDSIFYNETVAALTRGLMAYSLDPVTTNYDLYIRYGIVDRLDAGYKYAAGTHVLDAQYQFLGPTGTIDDPGEGRMYGSVALQYNWQNSSLPSKLGLNRLSSIFSYSLSRQDVMVPLIFSYSFGPEEKYGNLSFGLVYGHSFINYGFNPTKKFVRAVQGYYEEIPSFRHRESYSFYGGFLNAKIGYKYVYLVPSFSFYYQDYGTYNLFNIQQERFKGVTFIPSLGLQVNLGKKREKGY